MAAYNHYQPNELSVWIISHKLNSKFLAMDVLKLTSNGAYEKVMPETVEILDLNNVSVQFQNPVSGRARIVSGQL